MGAINPELEQTRPRYGQQNNAQDGYIIPFIEFEAPYSWDGAALATGYENVSGAEVTPMNARAARVRITDATTVAELLENITISVPTTIPRVDLPDVLTGIVATFNVSTGAGADSHPIANVNLTVNGTGSGSASPSSTSQGSASVIPDIQPEIVQRYCVNVPAMEYTFYMAPGAAISDILTKLTVLAGASVTSWPQFRPEAHTITLKGQQVSVSAKSDARLYWGGDATNGSIGTESGGGTSTETAGSIKSVRIPPTIHGTITIAGPTQTADADAASEAGTPGITTDAGTAADAADTQSASATATGSVSPTSLSPTTPASIPSTGLYAYSLTPGANIFGVNLFQAIVVNFADLL